MHDSGAERVLVADVAERLGVPFAPLSAATDRAAGGLLDPGLEPTNPLDVWGTGNDAESLLGDCLTTLADDDAVDVVALAVDLVPEYDGDESFPKALGRLVEPHRQAGRRALQPLVRHRRAARRTACGRAASRSSRAPAPACARSAT